ncbi:MAG: T9SS type A sorting domain-containing protein, partial [Bacteroidota bacterium]
YPNPAKDFLFVEFPEAGTYVIRDFLGRLLMQGVAERGKFSIPVRELAEGVYMIQLRAGLETRIEKIQVGD